MSSETKDGNHDLVHNEVTNDDIREYYSELYGSYQARWTREGHESLHVGYFDEEHTDHGPAVENMKRILADAVDIGPDDHVLDSGCGIGETATWIAKNRSATVTGLNISQMQIGRAREMAKDNGVEDQVSFNFDDFTEMETIEDDSKDVVWGLESICYADDKRDFLEQAKRVLKPGGRLMVADGYMTKRNLSGGEQKIMQRWLDGWRLPNLAHVDDFTADLEDLGFTDVNVRDVKENVMPSSKSLYYFSIFGYPIAKILQLINVKTETQVANAVACYYQYKALKKDLCTYGIVTAKLEE